MSRVSTVRVVNADGSEDTVVDPVPAAHGFLNQLMGAASASEALYRHLGHGRWVNFFLKTAKDALAKAEDVPLTDDEEKALAEAIAKQKGQA